jgi:hypothetical protein
MTIPACDNLKKIKKLQYKVLSKEKFGGAKKNTKFMDCIRKFGNNKSYIRGVNYGK